jgi:hypothetical protein
MCFTATLPVAAQQAQLSGFIEDATGSRVENAAIKVVNEDTQTERATQSNGSGLYVVPDLAPGHYRVEIVAPGFRKVNRTGILLQVSQAARLDFQLEISETAEKVNVTADASPINATDASISLTVARELVENLPLNGRSFQQLITLAPGVNLSGGQNSGDRGEFSVNGQRPTSNYFTVDGVGANLGSGLPNLTGSGETLNAAGSTTSLVSLDALQEFRILTSSFAPEYGRTPGGQVILLTRSGTNDFHGTAFDYFRNDVLDANDWFANRAGSPRAALRFNDFGGTLGGPIIKNSTFFFFSYEGARLRQPEFSITSVPDLASRQTAPAAVQPLLNGFPVPNGPELSNGFQEFSAGYSNPINTDATSLRIDRAFGPKLSMFARYNYAPSSGSSRGPYSLSGVSLQTFAAQSITTGLTYTITPAVVSETRLSWSQNPSTTNFLLNSFGGAIVPSVSALFVPPYSPANIYVNVDVAFPVELLDGRDLMNKPRQANVIDSLSYVVGAHQFKFGVDYLRLLPIVVPNAELLYNFGSVAAVDKNSLSFSNFAEGFVRGDSKNLSLYGQDTWRISNRLTFTYGLRWDLNTPPRNRYPNNGNYVPLLGDYATGNVSVGSSGTSLWNTQYHNFAPRLGLAYQIRRTPGSETVLRAGAGLYYDVATESVAGFSLGESFPSAHSVTVSNISFPVSSSTAALSAVSLTNPAATSAFYVYPRNFSAPRSLQWNISLEQALGSAQTVSISYVAAIGRDLLFEQYFPSVGANRYQVFYTDNSAASNYQSLQLQFQRRLSRSISATATYSWGHSLDDASSDIATLPGATLLPTKSNWGSSDFDVRQSFRAAFSWNIPGISGASGLIHAFTSGWGIDGIVTVRSPVPVDITKRYNIGFGTFAFRPNVVPGQPLYLYGTQYPDGRVFNPAAFVINPNAQGDLGRNSLQGFDLMETDLSLRRTFSLNEHVRLLVRGDLFNLFNHPNFANPDATVGDGTFGQSLAMANGALGSTGGGFGSVSSQGSALQTGGPRTAQISLKVQF